MTPNIRKRKYHPYVPLAFHLHILPVQALKELPRSTQHYWRKKDLEQLAGFEYAIQQQELLHTFSVIASNKYLLAVNKALVKTMAIGRFINKYRGAIKAGTVSAIHCLIRHIKRVTPVMGLRKTLKWCHLSYAQWRRMLSKQICARSPFLLCRRKHPSQLLNSEINTLATACHDPVYNAWPLSSIYHQLIRTGKLYCSLSSFYKYAAKLVNRPLYPKAEERTITAASGPRSPYRYYMQTLPFSEPRMALFVISTLYRTITQEPFCSMPYQTPNRHPHSLI